MQRINNINTIDINKTKDDQYNDKTHEYISKSMKMHMKKVKQEMINKGEIIDEDKIYKEALNRDIEYHLLKAEEDIKNGRVVEAKIVFKKWKEKYGI